MDKAICIQSAGDSEPKIFKGEIYAVYDVRKCSCGKTNINIGQSLGRHLSVSCTCGKHIDRVMMYWDSKFFATAEYESCHNEFIEKFKSPEEKPDVIKIPEKVEP